MPQSGVSLTSIFQAVAKTLVENQKTLNQADERNGDHGDNMVKTFQTIASALQEKESSSNDAALDYAAKQLSQSATSGSGQLYAQGLAQASNLVKGKELDSQVAMQLLQTLIGGGQPTQQPAQATGGDALGALLGGLMGGGQVQQTQQQAAQGNDLLGGLLGGLTGSGNANAGLSDGLDMRDLLNAGMAFMQARQSGGSNAQALIQAVLAGSGMGGAAYRQQSTQLVVSSFLQALASATGK
jgi:hypothetical protein